MLTKKDYIAIAAALKTVRNRLLNGVPDNQAFTVNEVTAFNAAFLKDSPLYDPSKFWEAVGGT